MYKIIAKKNVADLLGKLSGFNIFLPTEKGGVVSYHPFDKDTFNKELLLDFSNSIKPTTDYQQLIAAGSQIPTHDECPMPGITPRPLPPPARPRNPIAFISMEQRDSI